MTRLSLCCLLAASCAWIPRPDEITAPLDNPPTDTVIDTASPADDGDGDDDEASPTADTGIGIPAELRFTKQPLDTAARFPLFAGFVTITDVQGNPVPEASATVRLSLGNNPGGANLIGVTEAETVDGVAAFGLIGLDQPGEGVTLEASADGLAAATSEPFDVLAPAFTRVSTGLFGAIVTSLSVGAQPKSGNAPIYATTNAGLYKSTNRGATWTEANFGMFGSGGTVVADPVNAGVAYFVPTGPTGGSFGDSEFAFLKKTTDEAQTWLSAPFPKNGSTGRAVAVDPVNPDIVYVASLNGVFRSVDGGTTFTQTAFPHEAFQVAVDPITPSTLYATAYDRNTFSYLGVYKSIDSGASWVEVNTGLPSLQTGFLVVSPNALFAEIDNTLYRSTNGASSWDPTTVGFPRVVAYSAADPTRMYVARGSSGVSVSTDSGATWGAAVSVDGDVIQFVTVDPTDERRVYAASDRGIYTSANGGASWSYTTTGLSAQVIEAVDVSASNPDIVLVATRDGQFRSTNAGVTWTEVGDEFFVGDLSFDRDNGNRAFICDSPVVGSTNGGASWSPLGSTSIGCFALDVEGDTVYVAGSPGVAKSTNAGASFSQTGAPLERTNAVAITNAAGSSLVIGNGSGLHRSTDGGTTFSLLNTELINVLTVDVATPARVFAGLGCGTATNGASSNGGILVSTDGGASWPAPTKGLPCVSDIYSTKSTVFAAGRPYSVRSEDGGSTWVPLGVGTPTAEATSISASGDAQVVYLATIAGLFKSTTGGQ